jgi:hypothetical protein
VFRAYFNNVLEQDHRAIDASQHFRSFWGAWRTIAGYEAISYDPQRSGVLECNGHRVRFFIVGIFGIEV